MTEDDLNYYYDIVETLWLGGSNPTFERIRDRVRPLEVDSSHLTRALATLIQRSWVKLQQVSVGAWSTEIVYETWYVPIREHTADGNH